MGVVPDPVALEVGELSLSDPNAMQEVEEALLTAGLWVLWCGMATLLASGLVGGGTETACAGSDCGITDGSGPAFFSMSLLKRPIIIPLPRICGEPSMPCRDSTSRWQSRMVEIHLNRLTICLRAACGMNYRV